MNNACLIAACAAASRRNQNPRLYTTYIDFKDNTYYKVNFRMYLHFNPIMIVCPEEEGYVGSYFAPVLTNFIKTVQLESKTIAQQHSFMINSKKCKNGIDKYIENNLESFTGSTIWNLYRNEIIDKYVTDINRKYNIELDKSSVDYSIQFVYEVDSVEVDGYGK